MEITDSDFLTLGGIMAQTSAFIFKMFHCWEFTFEKPN